MRLNTPEAVLRVNRRALIAALLAAALCLVAVSLPIWEFSVTVFARKSGNTFVGDERYVQARAEVEAAAAESYRSVTKVYLEDGLKLKFSRDSETGKVIDIMLAHTKTDFAFFTDIMYMLRNVLKNSQTQSPNFASFYASNENTYQAILDQMKTEFMKTAG